MMGTMNTTAQRLDALMDQRRLELGLRWKQVTTRADITHQTLLQLRKGAEVSDLTVANVERALEWQPGSIERIRSGREPERAAAPDADPQPASAPTWDEEIVGPEGVVDEGEVLMWRDTSTGRLYRLADASDTRFHAEYEFPPAWAPDQAIDGLRRMLAMHRAIIGEMDREMDRKRAKR